MYSDEYVVKDAAITAPASGHAEGESSSDEEAFLCEKLEKSHYAAKAYVNKIYSAKREAKRDEQVLRCR